MIIDSILPSGICGANGWMLDALSMLSGLFDQPNYLGLKKMLDATVLRHEAIASNLANIETPNYKRLELDSAFSAQLQKALTIKDRDGIHALEPALSVDPSAKPKGSDGNTVHLETELEALSKNFLAHSFETQLITGNLLRLRLAITGRPV